jgi:transposase InsO family protein
VRRRGGRKRALGTRAPLAIPQGPNLRWSLDFLSDAFLEGRRFRILAVVDDFTRECLALIADTSLPGPRVVRELEIIMARRGRPAICVSDNGTELTSITVLRWSQEIRLEWHYIAPGKPTQNAFIESGGNRSARCDASLSAQIFPRLEPDRDAFQPDEGVSAQGRRAHCSSSAPPHRLVRPQPHRPRSYQLFLARRLCVKLTGICS